MKSTISWLIERRVLVLASHALVLLLAALGLPRLAIDNSPQGFFVDDASELEVYQRYRSLFGRDQTLRLVLEGDDLWTGEGLAYLAQLETDVAGTFGVVGTAGIYGHHRWRWPDWPPAQPEVLRQEATRDSLDLAAGWTTPDGELITVMALLYDLEPAQVRELVSGLERLASRAPSGTRVTIVGLPVVAKALDEVVLDIAERTFPFLVGFSVLLLLAIVRSPVSVLLVLIQVGWVMTVTFGAVGWQSQPLDMVQSILAPIVFVVTLANALYLLVEVQYRRRTEADPIAAAYRERGWAVLWAGLTTIVGFGSLALSELPPIRSLGMWTAFGLAVATVEAFILYPVLLSLLPRRRETDRAGIEIVLRPVGRSIAVWALAHRRSIMTFFVLLSVAAAGGVLRLETGADLLDYFEEGAPVRRDLEAVQGSGIGVTADLLFEPGEGSTTAETIAALDFRQPETLAALDELTTKLRRGSGVLAVLSPVELIDAGRRLDDPSGRSMSRDVCSAQELLQSIPETAFMLRSAITNDGMAARVSLTVPILSFDRLQPIFDAALAEARATFPDSKVSITGIYPLVLEGQRSLLRTMLASLGLTLLFVAAVFGLLVRRVRTLLAMVVPNLFPVLFVIGVMGWTGVPLDSTTLMIAAVVLGLAVDDTLHALGAFRRRAEAGGARVGAIETLAHTFSGHIMTTVVLASGFLLCGLSSFVPVARFGLLVAFAMVAALAADLLLVPVLLAGLSERDVAALAVSESRLKDPVQLR